MVSTRPLTSKSSTPCINSLVIVPSAPINIGISITFMFYSFFSSLARLWYLSLFSVLFSFTLCSAEMAKLTIRKVLFVLLIVIRSSCLAEISWSVCISKSWRILGISFSRTDSRLYKYYLFILLLLLYSNTICLYGKISISCTTLTGSPCPPSRV